MDTFAEKIILFLKSLDFKGSLPAGITVMNPFRGNNEVMSAVTGFYRKYYNDNKSRRMILGINPGRFGAGITGIPFTDTVRLSEKCGIRIPGLKSFETSSVFIYDMIDAYGGPEVFYRDYFISSVIPLGFTRSRPGGGQVNYNYYDSRELADSVKDFAIKSIRTQIDFGIDRDVCFCLGSGKNFKFLTDLNRRNKFFRLIEPLDHPRFIMQYRSKQKNFYLDIYLEKLKRDTENR